MKPLYFAALAHGGLVATMLLASSGTVRPEAALGPHGGTLRHAEGMTAELVLVPKIGARIYLRNADGKNPDTSESKVSFNVVSHGAEVNYSCQAREDFFDCPFPRPRHRRAGDEIVLHAERKTAHGVFVYKFPLPWGLGL